MAVEVAAVVAVVVAGADAKLILNNLIYDYFFFSERFSCDNSFRTGTSDEK